MLSIFDLILCYAIWLRVKKVFGYTIICDRYIEDTLLDFNHNFPQENVGEWFSWRVLKALSPIPAHRFLLIVPPEESARRSILKDEPFPDSPETLAWRFERYQELGASGHWCVIDCLDPLKVVQAKVLEGIQR